MTRPVRAYEVPEPIATSTKWTLENCSCVTFARQNSNVEFERILNPSFLGNNSYPTMGGLIRMTLIGKNGQEYAHVGVIQNVFSNGVIVYSDRMLISGECVEETRTIMLGDPRIDGFRI